MRKILTFVCFIAGIMTLLVSSCNKERQLSPQETSLITKAERWYTKSIDESAISQHTTKPDWEKTLFVKSPQGENLIVVPADKENQTNNPEFGMATAFVFKRNGQAIIEGNIVQVLGEMDFIRQEAGSVFAKHKEQVIGGFEHGAIILYDINHNYISGRGFVNGRVADLGAEIVAGRPPVNTKNIMQIESVSGKLLKAKLNVKNDFEQLAQSSVDNKKRIAPTYATQGEDGGGSGGGGGGGSGGSYGGSGEVYRGECIDWYWVTYNYMTGQIISSTYLYTSCTPPPTGGSTGGNPGQQPDTISNQLTDPCLYNMVNAALGNGLKNQITTFINNAFGKSNNYDLFFRQYSNAGATTDGYTSPGPITDDLGYSIHIKLNVASLDSASKEYVAATIFHEAVHAWIEYNYTLAPDEKAQHDRLATSWFNDMRDALMEMFPSLPLQDAEDLTWGGLHESSRYQTLDILTAQRIAETNRRYKMSKQTGVGTPCP